MVDATREEAIQWCIEVDADFYTPVYPPPNGWVWVDNPGKRSVLAAVFTNADDADITRWDVFDAIVNK